ITEQRVEQPDLRSSVLSALRLLHSLGHMRSGRLYLLRNGQIRAVISHGGGEVDEEEERGLIEGLSRDPQPYQDGVLSARPLCRTDHCYGILILIDAAPQVVDLLSHLLLQWCAVAAFIEYQKEELIDENYQLREEIRMQYSDRNIVGISGSLKNVLANARRVAASSATALIQGETGTGKELVARLIHEHSPRSNKPFVTVNCGALAESLLETELFGHVRGAFTGAVSDRKGRFETANGGTIFLDEIGEIGQNMQVRLLRVLQEMEVVRVGDQRVRKLDVRVIAATNRNLEDMVRDGTFRADLYYRLNVVFLHIPPLRDRPEDIPPLIEHFLGIYSQRNLKYIEHITGEALEAMKAYAWPGNVRELENCVEKMVVMAPGKVIGAELLPMAIMAYQAPIAPESQAPVGAGAAAPTTSTGDPEQDLEPPLRRYLDSATTHSLRAGQNDLHKQVRDKFERHLFDVVLDHLDNNKSRAAEVLGITRTTLNKRLKSLSSIKRQWLVD
ncbi:MAG: sigma-54 interaction domain-containing protein, partial [Planctomycetota bacterium]